MSDRLVLPASDRLAVQGGRPTLPTDRKHFVWPPISAQTTRVVETQLHRSISLYDRSGVIAELEGEFARYHGRKHALLTSSGTAALHSAFVGAGLGPGDEIICPAYTFYATITPIFFTGAVPVLVECRADGNIDPAAVERAITPRTKAIIVTHLWGLPCEMDRLSGIAAHHRLVLLEDGSHAHGAEFNRRKVGTFGAAAAFSLQGQKSVTGGEGGVLLTDNDEVFYRALLLGHYNKRCKAEIPREHPLARYATTGMGLKLRIHPLAAAIAQQQFADLENVLAGRQRWAEHMIAELSGLPGIGMPEVPAGSRHTWYGFILQYRAAELGGLSIDRFCEALAAEGCQQLDRPGSTCPLNLLPLFQSPEALFPAYRDRLRYAPGDFPHAEEVYRNSLKLPMWHREEDAPIVDG
jgi:dTDP-4-amino-4,6-dideoxygalactose transaminase